MVQHVGECLDTAKNGLKEREKIGDAVQGQIPERARSLGGQVVIKLGIHVEYRQGKHLPVEQAEHIGSEQKVCKLDIVEDGSPL